MPFMTGQTLLTILIVAAGGGLFLRLVAKEKRRRDKHLEFRLTVKMKELDEEAKRRAEEGPEEEETEAQVVIAGQAHADTGNDAQAKKAAA